MQKKYTYWRELWPPDATGTIVTPTPRGPKEPNITGTWTPEPFQKQRVCCPEKSSADVPLQPALLHTLPKTLISPWPGPASKIGLWSIRSPISLVGIFSIINTYLFQTLKFWVLSFWSIRHMNLGFGNNSQLQWVAPKGFLVRTGLCIVSTVPV